MERTPANSIIIKGARVHNLKNISLAIHRNRLTVITGLSGSGKSSLAFDTLYAEGQRRYVESLSSYARQFLGRINKPDVDFIKGIPPAIAIEQKVQTRNPRSTVGTSTEIYDYLKLLFARIGKTFSPVSGKLVKRNSVTDVIDHLSSFPLQTKVLILSPIKITENRSLNEQLDILAKQGFSRVALLGNAERKQTSILKISDVLSDINLVTSVSSTNLLVDRVVLDNSEDTSSRLADSIQIAYYEGNGDCSVITIDESGEERIEHFCNRFEADGMVFEEPTIHTFSFNSPMGACPTCEGFGKVMGVDEDLVIPDKTLSIYDDAIACWKGEKMGIWKEKLIRVANRFDFPIHRPYFELNDEQRRVLWTGNEFFSGLNDFFKDIEQQSFKIQYRVMLSRYKGKTVCPDCIGTRLKKQAMYVKVGGKSIHELVLLPINKLYDFFVLLDLDEHDSLISKRILIEILSRLEFLQDVGLSYLTLNRLSSTLSGGESQRINLATSLGSSLVGALYILDEPSIGLHPRDTALLIKVLKKLRNIGNTVVVVEHEEEIMKASDEIIDIGPLAGIHGGHVVFQGKPDDLIYADQSLTMKYLTHLETIPVPQQRRQSSNYIEVVGARENNLKNITVRFPLNRMTVVTGVSGSGKSSLINTILYSALLKQLNGYSEKTGKYDMVRGNLKLLGGVEMIDQNPIGRSSRSNPVTYIKAYDDIRKIFAEQHASVINGLMPSDFSFNVDGGRCDECQGEGVIKVEMQFMADIHLVCESCHGKRFKPEVLEVHYRDKNIFDVLELTVDEAIVFYGQGKETTEQRIVQKLQLLSDVGLGYVRLGQSSSTLSGGESQRIKLGSFLSKEQSNKNIVFIFDEPTTGLHFHDIKKLLDAFNALVDNGNTLIVVEHNPEIIKSADWVIDLGPEGGELGGNLVFEGTPEKLVECEDSYTGKFLRDKLK